MPDIILHILSGILDVVIILLPKNVPIDKKSSWNIAVNIGKISELSPITLLPIPIHIESIERAIPRYEASFASIFFELSKSEEIGSRIILIVIPRDLRNILYVCFFGFDTLP